MKLLSLLAVLVVSLFLYILILERDRLISFLNLFSNSTKANNTIEKTVDENKAKPLESSVRVSASKSLSKNVKTDLILRGQTTAIRKVDVKAELNGSIISKPRSKGSIIKKDDLLCEIEKGVKFSSLSESKVRLQEAKTKAAVVKSLGKKGYSTETNSLNQQTILESAKANVAKAEYEISKLQIRAPFSGILENNTAELGSFLTQGSLCATLIDLSSIKLIAYIPESQINLVSLGSKSRGTTASGVQTTGRVTFISKSADPVTRTFRVEVSAENSKQIRDGETVEIKIELQTKKAHLLPQSVLTLNEQGQLGVRTVYEKRARFLPVKVIRDQMNGVLITGLPEKVIVITVGQEFVNDGQLLNVSYENELE
jgi:multidrug efflux system membrane fusion protein